MKGPSSPTLPAHPDSALLEYLEGLLSPHDKAVIEEHLQGCSDCTRRLEELKELTEALTAEKEAFCPEPWQLFRYADSGEDPAGRIARHLDHCSLCREELETLRTSCAADEVMPDKVRNAVHRQFADTSQDISPERSGVFSRLIDRMTALFHVPATALGTVAAVVLLVVLLYPRGHVEPVVGLSSVVWDPASAVLGDGSGVHKRMPPAGIGRPPRPKIAMVLRFKGFPEPLAQERIDALYWALKPDDDAERAFEFVNPAQIKQALDKAPTVVGEPKLLAEQIYTDLGVSRVLVITVTRERERFRIDDELFDAKTARSLTTTTAKGISEADLPTMLLNSAMRLLGTHGSD